jgi:hypothetical protein
MRMLFLILSILFLVSCSGSRLIVKDDGRTVWTMFDGELSCLGAKCCVPYRSRYEKQFVICNETSLIDDKADSITLKIYLERIKKSHK